MGVGREGSSGNVAQIKPVNAPLVFHRLSVLNRDTQVENMPSKNE